MTEYEKIYSQDNPRTESGGRIQHKGTNICVDLWCSCGWDGHYDGDFFYCMECPSCHRKYAVGTNIKLIPLDADTIYAWAEPDMIKKPGLE